MDVRELAADYTGMVAAGKLTEAALKHWSDEVVTREAVPGEMAQTHGKAAAIEKADWWFQNHEVHEIRAEGPFVNGDSLLIILDIEATPHGGERKTMREIVGYRVVNDKVVEERYYY